MSFFEVIILGIIQGLTEFIPVSSSGHLDILPRLFGWQNASTILILALHFGTLLALLVYYRKKLLRYVKVSWKKFILRKNLKHKEERDIRVVRNVFISIIPALIVGLLLENLISGFYDNETNLQVVGPVILVPLILFGIVFIFEERIFKNSNKKMEGLNSSTALKLGLVQPLAFVRGVSRSGITILGGRFLGLKRIEAAEYSFLISIPLLSVTSIYGLYKLLKLPPEQIGNEAGLAIVGLITAFISGLLAVHFLLKYLKNNSLRIFGIYRVVFGVTLLFIILN